MADSVDTPASLLSDKCKKFGLLGAGIVRDPLTTLRLAEAKVPEPVPVAVAEKAPALVTPSAPPTALAPLRSLVPSAAVPPAKLGPATVTVEATGKTLTRAQILEILAETVRVQGVVQQEVSVLARKLAKEAKKKKEKKPAKLSFVEGHKRVEELNLPKEPLEGYGLTEASFQSILVQYEEDDEVMSQANQLLHPIGKGDPQRAQSITMTQVVDIHKFMATEMERVLQEFLEMPKETKHTFTGKACETTAELLVSIAVEQQLSVRCEDVEQAVMRYEDTLQQHPEFARYTEQLANMMQLLIGATQERGVQKAEFLQLLQTMGDSQKKFKAFSKQVYEEYRLKSIGIMEAYERFDKFSDETAADAQKAAELGDMSSVEMQLCYEEYRGDAAVREAWTQSGVETNLMMQSSLGPIGNSKAASSSPGGKKSKALKASEVVEMQELMVDEIRRTVQAVTAAAKPDTRMKPEIAMQLVQALASAAVERRYPVTAEELAIASCHHAATLQRNERLARASEEQQETLMQLARLFGAGEPEGE